MSIVRRKKAWVAKPSLSSQINWAHPWAQNLQGLYILSEGSGLTISDAANGPRLIVSNTASWSNAGSVVGLNCAASTARATALLPTNLQFGWPMTIACGFRFTSAPSSAGGLFGLLYDNAFSSPQYVLCFRTNSTSTFQYDFNSGGGSVAKLLTSTLNVGTDQVFSATVTSANALGYQAGQLVATNPFAYSNPTFSATSGIYIGANAQNGSPNAIIYWCAWWNRVLTATEHAAIGANTNAIWQIFQPTQGLWLFPSISRFFFIQGKGIATSTAVGNQALAFDKNVTSGNLIIVNAVGQVVGPSPPTLSVADSQFNSYTQDVTNSITYSSVDSTTATIWHTIASSSGPLTVTVDPVFNGLLSFSIQEVNPPSGAGTVVADSTAVGSSSAGSTSAATGNLTLTGIKDYIVAGFDVNTTGLTYTPNSTFTIDYSDNSVATEPFVSEYNQSASITPVAPGITISSSSPWNAVSVAYTTSTLILLSSVASYACAGDIVFNDGKINQLSQLFDNSGNMVENDGKINQITNTFSGSGDTTFGDGKFSRGILSLLGSGDISLSDGRISQIIVGLSGAGDFVGKGGKINQIINTFSCSGDTTFGDGKISQGILNLSGSGDLNSSDGKISQILIGLNGAGDFISNDGRISTVTTSLSGSGDFIANDGKINQIYVNINGSGDFITKNGRYSQLSINLNSAGDFNSPNGVFWGDTILFNSAGDLIAQDGMIGFAIFSSPANFNGAGDFICNDGRISQLATTFNNSGDIIVNDGRISTVTISLLGSGDFITNDGRISQIYTNINCAGDISSSGGVIWGDTILFNGAGDFSSQDGLTGFILFSSSANFNGAGDLICNDGVISSPLISFSGAGDFSSQDGMTGFVLFSSNPNFSGSGDFICNDGVLTNFSITLNGAGDFSCTNVRARADQISISCAGDCSVNNIRLRDQGFNLNCAGDLTLTAGRTTNIIIKLDSSGDFLANLAQTSSLQLSSGAIIDCSGDLIINGGKISGSTIQINSEGDLIITLPPSTIAPYILNILLHSNCVDIVLREMNDILYF